jgi:hypothetical protein
MRIFSRLMTGQHGHGRMDWVIVRSVIVGSLTLPALLQASVTNYRVVYLSNLFKICVGYAMLRLNRGQESLMVDQFN